VDLERQPGSNAIAKLAIERTIAIEGIVRFVERAIGMQVGVWARPIWALWGAGRGGTKGLQPVPAPRQHAGDPIPIP